MLVKDLLSVNKLVKPVTRTENGFCEGGEFIYQGGKLNIVNVKVQDSTEFIADALSCLADAEVINNNYNIGDIMYQAESIINSLVGLKLNEELSKKAKHNFLLSLSAVLAGGKSLGYLLESFSLLDKKGNVLFDYTAPIDLIEWECVETVSNVTNTTLLGEYDYS